MKDMYIFRLKPVLTFLWRIVDMAYNSHYNTGTLCVVQKWRIPLANWHGRLVNLPVGKLRVIVEFAPMKGLSIFGIIELRRMNRTCDFWAAIQWMYFKRIQQCGLIIVPQVRILLFLEAWWLGKNANQTTLHQENHIVRGKWQFFPNHHIKILCLYTIYHLEATEQLIQKLTLAAVWRR